MRVSTFIRDQGTMVTGHLAAFSSRTASEPTSRWPAGRRFRHNDVGVISPAMRHSSVSGSPRMVMKVMGDAQHRATAPHRPQALVAAGMLAAVGGRHGHLPHPHWRHPDRNGGVSRGRPEHRRGDGADGRAASPVLTAGADVGYLQRRQDDAAGGSGTGK